MSNDRPRDDHRRDDDEADASRDRRIGPGMLAFGGLLVASLAFIAAAISSGALAVGLWVLGTCVGIAGPLIAMGKSWEADPIGFTPSHVSWWEDSPRRAEPPFCERCPDMPPMHWQERVRDEVEPCAGYER